METFDGIAPQGKATGRRFSKSVSKSAADVKSSASEEIRALIADVEDLVARIADLKDADVARIRLKVQRALDTAKSSAADVAETMRRHAQRVAENADDYVHDSPWQAIGIAAVVGAVVGVLSSRRT